MGPLAAYGPKLSESFLLLIFKLAHLRMGLHAGIIQQIKLCLLDHSVRKTQHQNAHLNVT